MQALKQLGLPTRLILTLVASLVLSLFAVSAFFVQRHRHDVGEMMQSKSAVMRDQLRQKGIAITRTIGLASERAIAVMDLSFLAEVIESAVKNDREIAYGIVMDMERRAIVHTDPRLADSILDDPAAMHAASTKSISTNEIIGGESPILEVVAPVTVGDKPWGFLRLGMSEKNLIEEIKQTEARAQAQLDESIAIIAGVALVMIVLASLLGATAASRLVRPLKPLLDGVNRLREGSASVRVEATGSPEFEHLARAFNEMSTAIHQRDGALRRNMVDLEAAVEKAEEASRLKSEFLANISHELRTPLNAIVNVPELVGDEFQSFPVWFCEPCQGVFERNKDALDTGTNACPTCGAEMVLRDKRFFVGDADKASRLLERLRQQSRHLLALVNDLLDFSKLGAHKMVLYPVHINLQTLFADLTNNVAPIAEQKNVKLVMPAPSASAPGLVADAVKVMQMLINLVGNAIKFTPAGGAVTVAYTDQGQSIAISVSDTGIGIPGDKFDVIFESFRQVDGSHTRAHQGTGLGLAITKALAELHGGSIDVASVVGKGSTFTLSLPKELDAASGMQEATNKGTTA